MKQYLFKYKVLLGSCVTVGIIESICEVYIALLIQQLIDYVSGGDMNGFVSLLIFAVAFFMVLGILEYLRGTLQAMYLKKTLIHIKQMLFKGILAKDYANFYEYNTADYLSNLTNDINLLETNYISPYLLLIGDIVVFIGTTTLIFWINVWVALSVFAIGAFLLVIPSVFGHALKRYRTRLSDKQGLFTTQLKDIFEGYEVVKGYRMGTSVQKEFGNINGMLESCKFKSAHLKSITQGVSLVLAIGTQIAGMAIAGYFVLRGDMTIGMLFAVIQLSGNIQGSMTRIMERMTLVKGMRSVNQKLLNLIQDIQIEGEEEILSFFEESVVLEDVQFCYEAEVPVLKGISYTFEKSKKYAIVGESGCRKSTLIKLLMGYYRNYDGKILVDDQDVNDEMPICMTQLASMIHQNVYLFDKTMEYNVLLGQEFSEEQMNQALTQSGVAKFMAQISDGLNTSVGENGKNLSGGQKQRVAIARALIRQMPILMLDEGTSALDLQTAYDIEKTLLDIDELTLITITHKLSEEILSQYDEIIVMDHGQIVETGAFKELVSAKGAFYELYTLKQKEEIFS